MTDDIELPQPDPPAVTLESLAADVGALRRRVAQLESRTGFTSDDTLDDLDDTTAVSLLGGAFPVLEEARADAKRRRAEDEGRLSNG